MTRTLIADGSQPEESLEAARTAYRLMPEDREVARDLVRALVAVEQLQGARDLIRRSLSQTPEDREEALAIVARGALSRAQELVLEGDDEAALALLDAIEVDMDGAFDESGLRRRSDDLRRTIERHHLQDRFRDAEAAFEAGEDRIAREALREILDKAPSSDLALAARRLLERIEGSDGACGAPGGTG